ncbi:MAG: RDD family protein [Verrucomicrobiota bacterium]
MEVWIILEGEKVGPFHDFEIRRRISNGELAATTPAWHEGLSAWKSLVEIPIFTREFERVSPQDEISPLEAASPSSAPSATPPPLPIEPVFLRRFWARWLDLSLYEGVWWIGMWAAGQDIAAAITNPWVMFFRFVPWFALEAVLIQRFATTPGKWLLGLRVLNQDGSHLDLATSTRRSMRVLFSGIGFGFSYLAAFCQILSLVVSKRLGTTLWDAAGNHQVTAVPPTPAKLVAVVLGYSVAIALLLAVQLPDLVDQQIKMNPETKQSLEKYRTWGLPRSK